MSRPQAYGFHSSDNYNYCRAVQGGRRPPVGGHRPPTHSLTSVPRTCLHSALSALTDNKALQCLQWKGCRPHDAQHIETYLRSSAHMRVLV